MIYEVTSDKFPFSFYIYDVEGTKFKLKFSNHKYKDTIIVDLYKGNDYVASEKMVYESPLFGTFNRGPSFPQGFILIPRSYSGERLKVNGENIKENKIYLERIDVNV
jgi:hypothetical protein